MKLATWPTMNMFYLLGGTALALHLSHRQSQDLEFFTRDPLEILPQIEQIDKKFAEFSQVEWQINTREQLQCRLDDVSITMLAYPFPHGFEYHQWHGIAVADVRDIATQKVYTIGRRTQARDYLDLHAILTHGMLSLDELIRYAQMTYSGVFFPRLFL